MTLLWFITDLIFVTSWCWAMVWLLPTTQMNMLWNVIHGQINTFHVWPFCFFTLSFKSLQSSHAYFFQLLPFPRKPGIFFLTHTCHLYAHQILLNFIIEKKSISYQQRMKEINTSLKAVTPRAAKHTMWTTFVHDQRIQPLLPFVSGYMSGHWRERKCQWQDEQEHSVAQAIKAVDPKTVKFNI